MNKYIVDDMVIDMLKKEMNLVDYPLPEELRAMKGEHPTYGKVSNQASRYKADKIKKVSVIRHDIGGKLVGAVIMIMGEDEYDFPFIVVSPQCPAGDWWTDKVEVLIGLLDDIVSRYDVDTDRIYLTGLSMGGYGTWSLAAAHPDRFAAMAPICGGGKRFMAYRLNKVPVWAFHGAKDGVVPPKESEEMVTAIKARGGDAKLTVYPDAGHDSWTATYDNQELYDWFLKHRISDRTK